MAFVKFLKGSLSAFENLASKDENTLYFLTEEDGRSALYMGSRLIAGANGSIPVSELADLEDVLLNTLAGEDVLIYRDGKWKNIPFATLTESIRTSIATLEGKVYTKTEIDSKVEAINGEIAKKASAANVESALALKANVADVYKKTEVDGQIAAVNTELAKKAVAADVNNALNLKANAADVYAKGEVDTALNLKANAADVYAKTEVYTKSEVDGIKGNLETALSTGLSTKADAANVYTIEQADLAIDAAVAAAAHLKRKIVEKVEDIDPAAEQADQFIYMVPKNMTEDDKYDEYMVIDGRVERVGSWEIDLGDYATVAALGELAGTVAANKTAVDTALSTMQSVVDGKAEKATTLAGYGIADAYTKAETDSAIANSTGAAVTRLEGALNSYIGTNDARVLAAEGEIDALQTDMTAAQGNIVTLQSAVEGLEKGAEVNVVDSVEATEFTLVDRHLGIKAVAAAKITGLAEHEVITGINGEVAKNAAAIQGNATAIQNVQNSLSGYVTTSAYNTRVGAIEQAMTWGSL